MLNILLFKTAIGQRTLYYRIVSISGTPYMAILKIESVFAFKFNLKRNLVKDFY